MSTIKHTFKNTSPVFIKAIQEALNYFSDNKGHTKQEALEFLNAYDVDYVKDFVTTLEMYSPEPWNDFGRVLKY